MKLGLTSVTFRPKTIEEVFAYAKEAGIECIEWGVCDNHIILMSEERANKINTLSKEYGIYTSSLGAYAYMYDLDEALSSLKTAVMINAPVVRVWAGKEGSDEYTPENYETIVKNTKAVAEEAKKHNIKIAFEFHRKSLTDTPESAVKLIKDIGMENVGLYWQPSFTHSKEENIKRFDMVKPYCVGHLHIFNYTPERAYQPLEEIKENLIAYYSDIKNTDYIVMIEFVKDGSLESLVADAKTLKSVIK